jgi:hypothetical protein
MPIKMFHIGFEFGNPGFPKTNILSQHFSDPDDQIVFDIRESNVLLIGNFVRPEDIPNIVNFNKGPRILYVGEPIGKFGFSRLFDELFSINLYNYAIGCISNKPGKWIKYPFYADMKTNFKEVNAYIANTRLEDKKICTMINRHDPGNTRLPILRELSKFMHVVCPGRLANNCSSEEVDRIGTSEYIKQFIFNICCENYGECHPGYITEKLMNCSIGGAIPIYFGKIDEIDARVFNKDRILFLNEGNVQEVADRVLNMFNHPELLESFYRQPAFQDTAEEAVEEIREGVKTFFKGGVV